MKTIPRNTPALVIPFTVLPGGKGARPMTGDEKLAELRRINPYLAAAVDRIVVKFLAEETTRQEQ